MQDLVLKIKKYQFLFEELVKRDFKQKYKRTVLGMGWSILSPLLTLLVLQFVFGFYFGRTIPHYTIYLFCGNLLFAYYKESTTSGMNSLMSNAGIFSKINVPKYLFLFSKNVSSLINFSLTMLIFFMFVFFDGLPFTWKFFLLLFPAGCLIIFNLGMGLILSAMFVFFRDISYLYNVFTMLLMYASAIFYNISIVPEQFQFIFYLNPVYCYIAYFRSIVIDGAIPSAGLHFLCLGYALAAFLVGCLIYKKNNHKFLYYI